MRFYLDPETAVWFRRLFIRPTAQLRFPKTYKPLLTQSWESDPPCLDLTVTKQNKRFTAWLVRTLHRLSSGTSYATFFSTLADRIEEMAERSVVELLGDLIDTSRAEVKLQAPPPQTERSRALKHLRRRISE